MKKELVLSVFIFAFLFSNLVLVGAASDFVSSDLEEGLKDNLDKLESAKDTTEELSDAEVWQAKWDYLGNEWESRLLKNKEIIFMNSFFEKFSFVFLFLFAKSYSFSLVLLGIILLWGFFFVSIYSLTKSWGGLGEKATPYGVAFLLTIALAWTGLFEWLVSFIGVIVFTPDSLFRRIFSIVLVFVASFSLFYVVLIISKYLKIAKEKKLKEAAALAGKKLKNFVSGMGNAS